MKVGQKRRWRGRWVKAERWTGGWKRWRSAEEGEGIKERKKERKGLLRRTKMGWGSGGKGRRSPTPHPSKTLTGRKCREKAEKYSREREKSRKTTRERLREREIARDE